MKKILLYLAIFFLFSCEDEIKIVKGGISYSPVNTLQVNIDFITSKKSDAFIEYWTEDSIVLMTDTSLNVLSHKFSLLELKPLKSYKYRVMIRHDRDFKGGGISKFSTHPLPAETPVFTLEVGNQSVFEGYIILRKKTKLGAQLMINSAGEVVWLHMSDSTLFRPFSVVDEQRYIALKSGQEILEMDFNGDTTLNIKYDDNNEFDKPLHHEVFKNKDNNIVALTKELVTVDFREYGGSEYDVVKGDGILILDSLGCKVWSWSIFSAVTELQEESIMKAKRDWSHANALAYDSDGNFLISFRNFNQIWKINSTDGSIMWKLGENGDFPLQEDDIFYKQHAVHLTPNGNIMIFDNGLGNVRNTSRALAFSIDDNCELALKVTLPDSLFSFKQGSVYYIDDDKLLFCSSMTNRIIITNLQGDVLWQVKSDASFYRAAYIADF